jgi:hypothetical protein
MRAPVAMRHSARFERHETEMPQQRSGVVNGSMDESARAFVHKLLCQLIEARQIVRTTLPKGRPSIR